MAAQATHRMFEAVESKTVVAAASSSQTEALLRQLVSELCEGFPDPVPSGGEGDSILLDSTIDGERYLLIRMNCRPSPQISLSPREQEIVRMVAKGYANKTIAGVLNISSWTVCTHMRRIFIKLGVTSRAAMVARLAEDGRMWDSDDLRSVCR